MFTKEKKNEKDFDHNWHLTTVVVLTLLGVAAFAALGSFAGMGAAPTDDYLLQQKFCRTRYGNGSCLCAYADGQQKSFASDASGGGFDMAYEESNIAAAERLVIQNVDMSIVVTDPKTRMSEIADLAVEMGGFVVSSNLFQSSYGPNNIEVPGASMTIRIPSETLDKALENIKEGAIKVTYENRSGEDVTSQYVDLESRLKVKQATEQNFLKILDKAETTEDTLAVYTQLQQIQTEIEVIVGQMKYYTESAALSAVSIQLVAEETVKPIEIGGWKLQGTANDAVQDLIHFTQGFTQFLIRFVLSFLPALILIAIPAYGLFIGGRALFHRFRKSKPEAEIKEEEEIVLQ